MFKIGDILTEENYTEGAIWCLENDATISPDNWEIITIPEPTDEEKRQKEISILKQKLADSDYAIIKIAEGAATREEYADIIKQRAEWRTQINELEAGLE